MPTEKEKSDLLDTTFDDEQEWSFGATTKKPDDTTVIKQVKTKTSKKEEDDDEESTNLGKTKKDKEEEEEEEPEFTFGEEEDDDNEEIEDKKVDKKKEEVVKKGTKGETEEVEDDDKNIDDKKKDKDKKDSKDKKENTEEDDKAFFTTLATELKEKGIFEHVEIPKEDITEEQFFELQDQELEARVDEVFESFFEEMDEDGKAFLKYKKGGGDTGLFLNTYASTFDLKTFNEDNKVHVDKVLDYYLKVYEKLDAEELEDRKKYLEDGGKSKERAAKYYAKIQKDDEEAKLELINRQTKNTEKAIEDAKNFNDSIKKILDTTDTIGDFKLTKVEQKELNNYITKATIKEGKNRYVPPLTSELNRILRGKTKEDRQQLILIAKLIRDEFKIPESTKAKVTTQVVTKIKSNLQKAKQGSVRTQSSGSYGVKSLADYVDE